MRIAQIAPLFESVPPQRYGGTERVISYLTEELVAQGHEVTLFASADSLTGAELVAPCGESSRRHLCDADSPTYQRLFDSVLARAKDFDVVHFHTSPAHFPVWRDLGAPSVTTEHGRLDLPQIKGLYWGQRDMPLVSISESQREPMPWAHWRRTIHHGLPPNLYRLNPRGGDYVAFLGRICPEKRPDRAIEIARRAGVPLKIAAKVGKEDWDYYQGEIKPLIEGSTDVEFVGEITDREKEAFLGNALALLFPIDWPEPFGLVMIESMACGTPVIAFRRGSAPEVVTEGVTGFLVDSVDEAVEKIKLIPLIHRARCRAASAARFSAEATASSYLSVYEGLIKEETWKTSFKSTIKPAPTPHRASPNSV